MKHLQTAIEQNSTPIMNFNNCSVNININQGSSGANSMPSCDASHQDCERFLQDIGEEEENCSP